MVKASDSSDTFVRDWLIAADTVPVDPTWRQDSNVQTHVSGDVMSRDLTLTDGDHDIYFVVSQSGGAQYGTYAGTIQLDDKSSTFNGVNEVSPAKFHISVKDNKVVSTTSTTTKNSFQDQAMAWLNKNWKKAAAGVGIVIASGGIIAVAKSKGNGGRRRL